VSQQIKDSIVINETFDCDWINLGTSRSMDEIGKNTIVKPFRLLGGICKEFWFLLTRNYALCYLAITCHGAGFLKDSPFILMCKLFRKKIVIHQHNKGMANDVDRWPYRWLLPLCYRNAKVVLLSWYLYPDIEKVVKRDNVYICPNGIKVDRTKDHGANHSKENTIPRLLFLSNLIESKGVFVLLDALKRLKDKEYSFVCDFVGGETKEIDAKRFNDEVKKRGLNEVAIYHGRKYGKEKEEIFEKCDVFTLPTSNDCFPLVLLEAMAHHIPLVSTPIGGIPDIVLDGENGIICEEKDSHSLAKALESLLKDDGLRNKMGDEGYRIMSEKFTEDAFQIRLKEILIANLGREMMRQEKSIKN